MIVKVRRSAADVPAAAPLARTLETPSTLTVKTAAAPYTVTATNVSNGYAVISASWSSAWSDTNYVPVGDFSYLATNDGSNNCCVKGGITDLTTTAIEIIVEFNPNAAIGVSTGDTIKVYFIGVEGA